MNEQLPSITGRFKLIKTKALPKGFWNFIWHRLILGKRTGEFISETAWSENTVMFSSNHGRDLVLRRLISDNTYSLNLTYCELGTGVTTPAITDVALATPVARAAMANGSVASNVASVQFFFSDAALANGTYTEAGSFVDGTATLSSGQLFNHALLASSYVKTAGQDTTVQVDITQA